MTFLGLEKPVEYQSLSVFNPATAQMVLNANRDYINALYLDYRLSLLDMKDFREKYGEFMSPILKDMDWYEQNVTGNIRNFINDLYAQGIDPLRSIEGRHAVAMKLANMPTGDIAKVRLSAETAKEYLRSFGDDTNLDFEKLLGRDLSTWSTLGDPENGIDANGIWETSKASKFKTLQEYVHPSFANIKPHLMNEQEVRDRGYTYDPRYEYTGVSRADMERSMRDWLPGIRNEGLYKYYREQAKQDLIRRGYENPTEDLIDKQFVDNAITADAQMMTPLTREVDLFALLKAKEEAEKRVERYKHSLDNPNPGNTVLGLTDKIKKDIIDKPKLSTAGGKNSNTGTTYRATAPGDYDKAAINYYNTQSEPPAYGQNTVTAWFLGFNEPTKEIDNLLYTNKGYKMSFGPESNLHHTRIRMFDYNNTPISGRIKAFDDYLNRNRVVGYMAGDSRTVNYQKQNGRDIFDINGYIKINKKDIDGFLDERWKMFKDKTTKTEEQFKNNTMRQLGLVELVETDKEYVNPDDATKPGMFKQSSTTWVYMPVTRTSYLGGVYQADVDTYDDKNVVTGKELGGRQTLYQVRDINRKK